MQAINYWSLARVAINESGAVVAVSPSYRDELIGAGLPRHSFNNPFVTSRHHSHHPLCSKIMPQAQDYAEDRLPEQ